MKFRDLSGNWVSIAAVKGDDGFSPVIKVKDNTESKYTLEITTAEGVIITPNLRGDGSGGVSAEIVDTLPPIDEADPNLIYLTLISGSAYQANMVKNNKWISFGGNVDVPTVVQEVIEAPELTEKIENTITESREGISDDEIAELFK